MAKKRQISFIDKTGETSEQLEEIKEFLGKQYPAIYFSDAGVLRMLIESAFKWTKSTDKKDFQLNNLFSK